MYHYVYKLTFPDGMMYVGVHSTRIQPQLDTCYLGSGKALPERTPATCVKEILKEFPTRKEAVAYEIACIDLWDAIESPLFYNQRRTTFDKHGTSLSEEHREQIRLTSTGRSRPEIRKYVGENRTPAQKDADRRNGEFNRGRKNPKKGHPGTSNNGFRPWYYVTPQGAQIDVVDRTKQEMASTFGMTERQMAHRFHYTNQHQPCRYTVGNAKGYIFGDLPRPVTEQD